MLMLSPKNSFKTFMSSSCFVGGIIFCCTNTPSSIPCHLKALSISFFPSCKRVNSVLSCTSITRFPSMIEMSVKSPQATCKATWWFSLKKRTIFPHTFFMLKSFLMSWKFSFFLRLQQLQKVQSFQAEVL